MVINHPEIRAEKIVIAVNKDKKVTRKLTLTTNLLEKSPEIYDLIGAVLAHFDGKSDFESVEITCRETGS